MDWIPRKIFANPEDLRAAWSAVAERVKGRFVPPKLGFWAPDRQVATIVATLEPGIEVTVDYHDPKVVKETTIFTRLVAAAPGAGQLQVKLGREGLLASVGKALGMHEVVLGDPTFDERYLVRTSDPELARVWLAEPARRALLATSPGYEVELAAGKVKAEREYIEMDIDALVAAMHAVAALAGGGRVLMDAWRRLAAELGGTLAGEHFVPGEVRFDGEVEGRQLAVETTAEPPGIRVRRELAVRDASPFEVPAGQLLATIPEAVRLFRSLSAEADWQALQPARFTCDGETAVVSWDGYAPDGARCRTAASLLGAVESGPYR